MHYLTRLRCVITAAVALRTSMLLDHLFHLSSSAGEEAIGYPYSHHTEVQQHASVMDAKPS